MKVLLAPVGSRGDVQPQLLLGEELARRGHQVTFAAPPNFRDWAEARGFAFIPVGEDMNAFIRKNAEMTEQNPLAALPGQIALLRAHAERQVRDLFSVPHDADVVVAAGLSFAAKMVADQLGVPHVFVCYTLSAMRSGAHPPAVLPFFGLPRLANHALWAGITRAFDLALGGTLNRLRREFGIAPERRHWHAIHASEVLLAQDVAMGELPRDTPGNAKQIPAIVAASQAVSPSSDLLERFVRGAGDGPSAATPLVYLGFGSMPSVDRTRVVGMARELFEEHGARVILFSGHDEDANVALPPGVFSVTDTDQPSLFPRMDLLVHHGGAGTTAAALRSGVPQLIVPHIVDQFFHGRRVAELGLGPAPVPKANLSTAAIAGALKDRFRYWSQAQAVKATLDAEGGAKQAADHIEGLVKARD